MSKSTPFRLLLPVAACVVVLGLLGGVAQSARPYGRPNPAEHNYNLLVQGFQSGQLSLKKAIPPGFAQLSDPRDPKSNDLYRQPPYWLHDLSYYRGRLYLYFGVTPAVLLFWPWAALTGHYLSHEGAAAFFCGLEFLAGAGLLLGLWRRYFPEVGAAVAAAGVLALGLATGMPIILQRADVYEVATSCGTALSILALAGVWLAVEEPARRVRWLAAASLAYGLAVGARPSVLFGAVILWVPVVLAWRERTGAGSPPRSWQLLGAAVLPLMLCGLGLMAYNYERFGRPFEFGQHYQLAGERVEAMRFFSPGYLWFNFRVNFLEPAQWSGSFPFFGSIASPLPPPGHAKVESGCGVLTDIPVLWLALAAPLAWRGRTGTARTHLRAAAAAAALLFGTCALFLCLFIGNAWRYEAEFLPSLALLSLIGIFGLERTLADRPTLRLAVRATWSLLLAFSIAFNLLESIHTHAEQIDLHALGLIGAGKVSEGFAEYDRALRWEPGSADVYTNRALARINLGDYDRAIADCDKAIHLNPKLAAAYDNRAFASIKKGDFDRGIADCTEAIRLNPGYAEAYNNRAAASSKKGDLNRAIADYDEAIRLVPRYAEAYNNRASAYAKQGDFNRAIADCDEAIRLKPDYADCYSNRADASAAKGEYGRAVADYDEAIRLNPGLAEAYNNAAWLLAACSDPAIRNGARAVAYAQKACELTAWKEADDLDTLAVAEAEAGHFDEAIKWETQYIDSGLSKEDTDSAHRRLSLYALRKAYHEEKKPN